MNRKLLILKAKNCDLSARQIQVIEQYREKIHKNGIFIEEQDIQSFPSSVDTYSLSVTPTVVLLNNRGEVLKKWSGFKNASDMGDFLELDE